jgi:hypothetical protein
MPCLSCTKQDTTPGVWGTIFGGITGQPSSDTLQAIACNNAIDLLNAQGLDPCDPANADALQNAYQAALANATTTASTTPRPDVSTSLCATLGIGCPRTAAPSSFPWLWVVLGLVAVAVVLLVLRR